MENINLCFKVFETLITNIVNDYQDRIIDIQDSYEQDISDLENKLDKLTK